MKKVIKQIVIFQLAIVVIIAALAPLGRRSITPVIKYANKAEQQYNDSINQSNYTRAKQVLNFNDETIYPHRAAQNHNYTYDPSVHIY